MSLPSLDRHASRRAGGNLKAWLLQRLLTGLACGQITLVAPAGKTIVLRGRDAGLHATIVLHRWRAKARSAFKIRINRKEAKGTKVFILLGAQASLPACFGQSVIAGNPAGKDACDTCFIL